MKTPLVTEIYEHTRDGYVANHEWGLKTEDNVFVLSALEAEKYFDTEEDLLRAPTEAFYIYTGDTGYAWWWLRTHGTRIEKNYIMYIGRGEEESDIIDQYGWWATDSIGVCPAIWLDLSALEE